MVSQGVGMKRTSWRMEPDSVGWPGRDTDVARPAEEEVRKRRVSKCWGRGGSEMGGIGCNNRGRGGEGQVKDGYACVGWQGRDEREGA